MRTRSAARVVVGALACVWVLGWWPRAAGAQDPGAPDRAAALRTFTEEVERYAALRARYEAPLPPFDLRRDPWSLRLSRHFLASAIRTARRDQMPGSIFTAPVSRLFRAVIAETVYGADVEGLVEESFDPEDRIVDLTLNEPVPEWAMQDVPGALLARLPPLPAAIEYRLVGDALILWDVHAEILIDALPDALLPL